MNDNLKIIEDIESGDYHTVTRGKLYNLLATLPDDAPKTVVFQSPTGTGKTFMVCNEDEALGDKRIMIVPTVSLSEQIAGEYGVKLINGNVETFTLDESDNLIVSTYDGLKRFISASVDYSDWYLCIDEYHQLTGSAGYRGRTIEFIATHALRFKGVILMSATPPTITPITPSAFYLVRSAYLAIDLYHTQSENYIAMAIEELKGTDTVYIAANNKEKLTALARVAIAQNLTVGIMTSDLKGTKEFQDILSGAYKPQIILCTCVIYDGINIDPTKHVLIITRYTKIRATELVQLSSRNRAQGKKMIKPSKIIICVKHAIFENGRKIMTVDEKIEHVAEFGEMLTGMCAHLRSIGRLDESINSLMNITYNHLVNVEIIDDVHTFSPNVSSCIGDYEDEKRQTMTLGDLIEECKPFNINHKGEIFYEDCQLLEDTKERTKEVKKEVKDALQGKIAGFRDACACGTAKEYLDDILGRENTHKSTKKELDTISALASARRRLMKLDEYDDSMMPELIKQVGTKSDAKLFKKKVIIHEIIGLAINDGEGTTRDDVATIRNMWELVEVGAEFTSDTMKIDYEIFKVGPVSDYGLPKNGITLLKQMFEVEEFRGPKDENGKRARCYRVIGKQTMAQRIRQIAS